MFTFITILGRLNGGPWECITYYITSADIRYSREQWLARLGILGHYRLAFLHQLPSPFTKTPDFRVSNCKRWNHSEPCTLYAWLATSLCDILHTYAMSTNNPRNITPPWPSLYNPGLEILHIEHNRPVQEGGAYLYHIKGMSVRWNWWFEKVTSRKIYSDSLSIGPSYSIRQSLSLVDRMLFGTMLFLLLPSLFSMIPDIPTNRTLLCPWIQWVWAPHPHRFIHWNPKQMNDDRELPLQLSSCWRF